MARGKIRQADRSTFAEAQVNNLVPQPHMPAFNLPSADVERLHDLHVLAPRAFRSLASFERDGLSFAKVVEAGVVARRVVEEVLVPIVGEDEAETLAAHQPLDRAVHGCCHSCLLESKSRRPTTGRRRSAFQPPASRPFDAIRLQRSHGRRVVHDDDIRWRPSEVLGDSQASFATFTEFGVRDDLVSLFVAHGMTACAPSAQEMFLSMGSTLLRVEACLQFQRSAPRTLDAGVPSNGRIPYAAEFFFLPDQRALAARMATARRALAVSGTVTPGSSRAASVPASSGR